MNIFSKKDKKVLVTCVKCRHAIYEGEAKKVTYERGPWVVGYFCPACAPKYDNQSEIYFGDGKYKLIYEKHIPEHWERVNEDGTPYKEKSRK